MHDKPAGPRDERINDVVSSVPLSGMRYGCEVEWGDCKL